jgi:hypothetical protein
VRQREGATPLLPGQNPFAGDRSEAQVTDIDIHTSGTLDSDSGDDSEDDKKDDSTDESGVEYEFDGNDSDEGRGPVLPSHSKAHVRNSFPVNAQDQNPDNSYDLHDFHDDAKNPDNGNGPDGDGCQDTGAEYSTHHDTNEPVLGAFRFCETGPSSYLYRTRL